MTRQIVLDTETTGLNPNTGDRVIEIGCFELFNRRPTGNTLHYYLNPDRIVEEGALKVHGITNEFLQDKPRFYDVADDVMSFLKDAELIIHNAEFDVGFLNMELSLLRRNVYGVLTDHCTILDTLALARQLYPGQRNSLDALCKRLQINNSHRTLHGALLDAEILAQVYLGMTGGQKVLFADGEEGAQQQSRKNVAAVNHGRTYNLQVVKANAAELTAHQNYFEFSSEG